MIQVIGSKLSQWDVGRRVSVSGDATHVHFANRGDSEAVIMEITNGEAMIPDYLMRTGKDLLAYAVKDGVTLGSKAFAVRNREKPENYIYEDDQRNYIYKLIEDVETAIANANEVAQDLLEAKENGEFDGPQGEQGDPGEVNLDDTTITTDAAWSSKNTVDKLCPSFTESGSVVSCEPVEGYPLKVISTLDANVDGYNAVNLHHGGKNLIPKTEPRTYTENGTTFTLNKDGSVTISGTPTTNTMIELAKYVPSSYLRGKQLVVNNNVGESVYLAIHLFCDDGTQNWNWLRGNRVDSLTKVAPDNTKNITSAITVLDTFDGNPVTFYPQLEFGTVDTEYEQPKGFITHTANLDETVYGGRLDWNSGVLTATHGSDGAELAEPYTIQLTPQKILALSGVNTLCSDTGDTEAKGKADPKALFDKLTNAILSLGGNV